jgi:hypothetical protein
VTLVVGAAELRRAVLAALESLRAQQDHIDAANVYPVPDGDTGTNMALTMASVAEALIGVGDDPAAVARAVAQGALVGARGNSGVLLAEFLRGLCEVVDGSGADAAAIVKGFQRAAALCYEAMLHPVEGTMLSVARAAADALGDEIEDVLQAFETAAAAARRALDRTPEQLGILKAAGVVDAGGMGLCAVLDAFTASLAGREPPVAVEAPASLRPGVRERETGSSAFAYEVQYLLEAPDDAIATVRSRLGAIGDSVAVVGGHGLWNVHVHTNDVGHAVEIGILAGTPRAINVVAFADQIASAAAARTIPVTMSRSPATVVAVVRGEGLRALFGELGAGALVEGGATMNPSVGELAEAIARTPSQDVIVLPNDANVAAAARQAATLVTKRVEVVPTQDLAQGFAAMVAYGDAWDLDRNASEMSGALERTRTGRIVAAARDGTTPAGPVRAGQFIGFDGAIPAVVSHDPIDALTKLVRRLGPAETLTVFTGAGVAEDEVSRARSSLVRCGIQRIEVLDGGQPVERYLLAVE